MRRDIEYRQSSSERMTFASISAHPKPTGKPSSFPTAMRCQRNVEHDLMGIEALLEQPSKDQLRSKRLIVTGGAGFIGSWLCDLLVEP